jgi:hypothetical protein
LSQRQKEVNNKNRAGKETRGEMKKRRPKAEKDSSSEGAAVEQPVA